MSFFEAVRASGQPIRARMRFERLVCQHTLGPSENTTQTGGYSYRLSG